MTEIAVSIIVSIGGIIVAIIQTKKNKAISIQNDLLTNELNITKKSLDLGVFLKDWSDLYNHISGLINTTEIDRFIVLRAWNGARRPKWTTAVLQIRESGQEPVAYIHFELDNDYIDRLAKLDGGQLNYMHVDEMQNSAIKSVYEAEGVKASLWGIIEKQPKEDGSVAITYCSYSTHQNEGISEETKTKCRLIQGQLKGVSKLFNNG